MPLKIALFLWGKPSPGAVYPTKFPQNIASTLEGYRDPFGMLLPPLKEELILRKQRHEAQDNSSNHK
jgi:hypothetical protein